MLFATRSFARRSRNARPATPRAAVEALDPRRLMSVTAPADYVQVASLTLDATTLAAQTVSVEGGRDYFFKATGTHVLAQNPTRLADAAGYQPSAGSWAAGTHLHVRLAGVDVVNWGATHASDSEYGASYTAAADATLSAVITDSYRFDNQGSLNLIVYERADLVSLTGTEQGGGTADVLSVTPDGAGQATVNLSAAVTPDADAARAKTVWAAYDGEGLLLGGDTFDVGGDSITFTFAGPADAFTIRAGVDTNGNGVLDTGETTRSLIVERA